MTRATDLMKEFSLKNLGEVASLSARPDAWPAVASAVSAVAQDLVGWRMCGVSRFFPDIMGLQRIHTSHPAEYPVGGRKSKRGLDWADQVLLRCEPFIGVDMDAMRSAFDDHEKLFAMGMRSIINTPIVFEGRCLGTFNLTHEEGWYRPGDEKITTALAYLLVPGLLAIAGETETGSTN